MSVSSRGAWGLWVVLGLASAQGCTGCFGANTSPVDKQGSALPSTCETSVPTVGPQELDILFVIDNSGSMAANQASVARELPAFVEAVRQSGGITQDFRVGVVTTSVYEHFNYKGNDGWEFYPDQSGRLQAVPDVNDAGQLVPSTTGERMLVGDDPALMTKFGRLVQQGTKGSGQETPFEAVRLALLGEPAQWPLSFGGNRGFLRDGARLLVVVVSDEDDCSESARPPLVSVTNDPSVADCVSDGAKLTRVADYFQQFTVGLTQADGSPKEVIWGAIAPVSPGTKQAMVVVDHGQVRNLDCPTSFGAGTRHRAMAELFDPSLQNLDSICNASYHDSLVRIASIASVSQNVTVRGVPDPRMLQVVLTRADGSVETCTLANGGLTSFTTPDGGSAGTGRLHFGNQCARRGDDQAVTLKLLCIT